METFRPQQIWHEANTNLEIHPLADSYPQTDAITRRAIIAEMKEKGFDSHFPIFLASDGRLVAGRCRYSIAKELGIKFLTSRLSPDEDLEQFCIREQDNRKHLPPDELAKRREERRERVVAARKVGQSTRAIAEQEGISQTQVNRDIKTSAVTPEKAGEPHGSPESNGNGHAEKPPAKVTGKDGKEYAAAKPPKKKAGQIIFDWKRVEEPMGKLTRAIDECANAYAKGEEYKRIDALLAEAVDVWKAWKKKLVKE